jgi:hypothetical protein
MVRNNTLTEPAGSAVNFVPRGTWLVSPGITLTNPQAGQLSEEDRVALFERVITLDGDISGIPDVLHPLEQRFYPPIPELNIVRHDAVVGHYEARRQPAKPGAPMNPVGDRCTVVALGSISHWPAASREEPRKSVDDRLPS